ncbi:MAG: hypothetical protein LQ339_002500 [Xanthoria mediterranea]|nr:MAG: hypothetical protein LQ339_002500 [Xanthoria mediterranea]
MSVTPRSKQFTWDPQVVEEVEGRRQCKNTQFDFSALNYVGRKDPKVLERKRRKKPEEKKRKKKKRGRIIELRRCMKPTHQQSDYKSLILPKGEGAFIHSFILVDGGAPKSPKAADDYVLDGGQMGLHRRRMGPPAKGNP